MELETVLYRVEGNVAVISLNRTKAMNSLNKQIFADLTPPSRPPVTTLPCAAW